MTLKMAGYRFRKYFLYIISCSFLLGLTGCGYNLQATGQPKGIAISSLAIPLMKSPSSSLGFEGDFTRMIRQEFVSHSQIPLVSRQKAAMVLVGTVTEIKTEPLSYRIGQDDFEVTTSRWLRIRLSVKLQEGTSGKIIWDDQHMEEKAAYTVTSDPLKTRYNKRKAAEKIARLLSERIYLKTMERF
ncbi:MAG: LPS assembly lipoprotein LptE [Desulfatiglandaceae bacterium]